MRQICNITETYKRITWVTLGNRNNSLGSKWRKSYLFEEEDTLALSLWSKWLLCYCHNDCYHCYLLRLLQLNSPQMLRDWARTKKNGTDLGTLFLQGCQNVFTRWSCSQLPIFTCRVETGFATSISQGSQKYPEISQESVSIAKPPWQTLVPACACPHHFL